MINIHDKLVDISRLLSPNYDSNNFTISQQADIHAMIAWVVAHRELRTEKAISCKTKKELCRRRPIGPQRASRNKGYLK
jgi:hypothetical protein